MLNWLEQKLENMQAELCSSSKFGVTGLFSMLHENMLSVSLFFGLQIVSLVQAN